MVLWPIPNNLGGRNPTYAPTSVRDAKCHQTRKIRCNQRVEAFPKQFRKYFLSSFFMDFYWIDNIFAACLRLSHWPCNYFFLIACDLCVRVREPWTPCINAHFHFLLDGHSGKGNVGGTLYMARTWKTPVEIERMSNWCMRVISQYWIGTRMSASLGRVKEAVNIMKIKTILKVKPLVVASGLLVRKIHNLHLQ